MNITKTQTCNYEVKFYPYADVPVIIWGDFKQKREEMRMSYSKLSHCFCCGHKFADDEKVVVVTVKGEGNRFACQKCLEREVAE